MRLLAVFAALLLAESACAAPNLRGEFGHGYDSNSNHARRGGAERAAQHVRGTLVVTTSSILGRNTALSLQGGFDGEHNFDFAGLSNGKLTGLARLFYRTGSSFFSPTVAFTGAASHWEYDSRLRDSAEYRAALHATAPLTTRISGRLGVSAVWRDAHSAVFDINARSALVDVDWHLLPRLALYFGYQYREGDLVATGSAVPAAALAYEPDDAFGIAGDLAYRIAADAQIGTFGINYALSPRLALDVQGQLVEAESDAGARYERWLSSAGLLFRF